MHGHGIACLLCLWPLLGAWGWHGAGLFPRSLGVSLCVFARQGSNWPLGPGGHPGGETFQSGFLSAKLSPALWPWASPRPSLLSSSGPRVSGTTLLCLPFCLPFPREGPDGVWGGSVPATQLTGPPAALQLGDGQVPSGQG